jgi:hypothetical protein
MAADGIPASAIADSFPGVAVETIRKAARRETFRNVTDFPSTGAAVPQTYIEEQMALMKQAAAAMRLQKDAGADANEALRELTQSGGTPHGESRLSAEGPGKDPLNEET